MKNILVFILVMALVLSGVVACSPAEEPEEPAEEQEEPAEEQEEPAEKVDYEDGIYYAEQDEFGGTGWKYHVILTVEDGKFVDAQWKGTNRVPQTNKYDQSVNGDYGMVEYGDASAPWFEQADATIDYFLENQSVEVSEDFYTSEDGHTDAIAGVTIHVVEFFELAEKAVANGPVPEGDYTDGYPMAAAEVTEDDDWQSMIQLTVVNGTIVSANVNAVATEENEEGEIEDKDLLKEEYGMVEKSDAELEWYEQAELVEEYIVENQDLDIPLEDGYTDAIAGVSIHVDTMVELFNEAVGGSSSSGELEDGIYYAEQDEFGGTGWKYHVILTVEDGKFVDAQWKGTNRVPQTNKYDQSVNGDYGMVEYGDASAPWFEQADATIDYFLENQSVEVSEDFYTDEEGHTDAIAGVSVHVVEFFELAEKAVANGPVPEGDYTDGYPMAAAEVTEDDDWQSMIQLTVVNGTIVSANVNAVATEENEEGEIEDKDLLKEEYGMVEKSDAELEWYEQAELVEEYIVENQDLDIPLEDGYTDAIAGVSIHVDTMVELFNEAVK